MRLLRSSALWALLASVALALIYGRVGVLNLTTGVVGGNIDGYEDIWGNWWVKTALLDLHRSFFATDYLYYPTGISLRFHALTPFVGLVAIPFNLALGYIATTNLLFLAALALTTFFAFLLIRDLVGNPWAAFAGAALFTYANRLVVGYYTGGQMNYLSREWLPLYLFFLWRTLHGRPAGAGDDPPRRSAGRWPIDAALAVLVLLITSLTDWQYVMFAVFTTLLYFAFLLLTRRPWPEKAAIFGKLALIGGVYTAIALPILVWPMIQEALANPWLNVSYESQQHSLDARDLLVPGLGNPGYLAGILAVAGLATARRQRAGEPAVFWALAAGVAYLIALGPVLLWDGRPTGLPLPYRLLQDLPVFSVGRDPWQFSNIALLGLGVLVALGLRWIFDFRFSIFDFRSRSDSRTAIMAIRQSKIQNPKLVLSAANGSKIVAAGLLVALFLALSLGGFVAAAGAAVADPPDWPAFYRQIGQDPADYAILELPSFTNKGLGEDHYQVYQVLHGKPRFGGRWSRDHKLSNPNNFVKHASLFHDLFLLDYPPADRTFYYPARDFLRATNYATQGRAILNYYRVRYLVLYKDALYPGWDEAAFQRILGLVVGAGVQPTYEDRIMRVYQVPAGPPAADPLTLDVGDGWFPSTGRADGVVYRWADNAGDQASEFYSMNLTSQPLVGTLRFTVLAFQQPRTVVVAVNGVPATTLHLKPADGEKAVAVALTLPPGNNLLTLSTPEPAQPTGNPRDSRLLSFALYGVTLAAGAP